MTPAESTPKVKLRCRAHGMMAQWLAESGGSLAITTYTSGKLVFVASVEGRLRYRTVRFARPMGMAVAGDRLALVERQQIHVFQQRSDDQDAFALQRTYETGKIDAHDVAFGARGVFFANTRYNCVARVAEKKHFLRHWQPPFIEGMVRGDRCHLNGIGMLDGRPKFATAFCATGHPGGWREQDRFTGGVLIDIPTGEIAAGGLCMPHSPRHSDGRWWLCDSGRGLLSTVDIATGLCEEVCALPGFTRGLSFVGNHALVGLSRIREKHILDAPPVRVQHERIRAGVALVDVRSGRQIGGLEFLDGGREVYDVVFLPDIRRPRLILPTASTTRSS